MHSIYFKIRKLLFIRFKIDHFTFLITKYKIKTNFFTSFIKKYVLHFIKLLWFMASHQVPQHQISQISLVHHNNKTNNKNIETKK